MTLSGFDLSTPVELHQSYILYSTVDYTVFSYVFTLLASMGLQLIVFMSNIWQIQNPLLACSLNGKQWYCGWSHCLIDHGLRHLLHQ